MGLAISYVLSMTGLLNGVVTFFTETEKQMISVERINQYVTDVPEECHTESTEVTYRSSTYHAVVTAVAVGRLQVGITAIHTSHPGLLSLPSLRGG